MGGLVGLLLKMLSGYLTRHINKALQAEDLRFKRALQPECLLLPPLKLLPSVEPLLPPIMLVIAVFCGVWQPWPEALFSLFFVANCLLLAAIDARTGILPNALNVVLVVSGLVWNLLIQGGMNISGILAQVDYVWAMGLGYAVPLSMAWLYSRMANVQPMGRGDAKMLAGLGAWLGLNGLVTAILVATVGASFWVLGLMLQGRYKRQLAIPFGPFLAFGAIFYLIWSVSQSHA